MASPHLRVLAIIGLALLAARLPHFGGNHKTLILERTALRAMDRP